jgi:hypothetical protein
MKLAGIVEQILGDNPVPKVPRVIMWMPPSGAVIECPDMEAAEKYAPLVAAKQPGRAVGVYELVGYAFAPVNVPGYTPSVTEVAAEIPDMRDIGADR